MARDSDRMHLHLFGHANDVFDFESSTVSDVNPGVSFSETLFGDVGGINSSVGMFSETDVDGFHMSSGCNVTGEKEGFYQENFNGLTDGGMLGVVDGGCDGKVGKFSHGLVHNEDDRTLIQSSGGGCAVSDKDLVFGLNNGNGVQIEQKCEDAEKVAEVSLDMEGLFSRKSFLSDAQVTEIQNYMQYNCCGLDLVVDLNSYKNTQEEDNVPRDSVFSDVNYRVSDLVWGNVRGHPWWPGQIYDPAIASETVKSYWEEDCYLIAYFGGQKFAWNEVSTIKPFYEHFSEMAKQTDCESFRFAVDCALLEASRRVAFGLSCPCLPDEVSSDLKTEVVANAEICNQSFEPAELISFVQSLAQSPLTEFDRLDLVRARGQVSAFYRSKGYSQLPEFAVHDRLFIPLPVRGEEQCNGQVLKIDQCFLPDLISEKNSQTPYGEFTLEKKAGDNFTSRHGRKRKTSQDPSYDCFQDDQSTSRRGRKRKTSPDPSYDCFQDDQSTSRRGRKRKTSHDPSYDCFQNFQIAVNSSTPRKRGRKPKAAYNTSDDCFQNFQIAVNSSIPRKRGRKPKLACNTYDNCFNNSQTGNSTKFENVSSVHDMWSQLCLAAKDPAGESCYTEVIHYFADFRKATGRNNSAFLEQGFSLEQKCDGETTAITSIEAAAVASTSTPMVGSIEAAAVASTSTPLVGSIEAAAVASTSTPMVGSIEAAAVASTSKPIEIDSIEDAAVACNTYDNCFNNSQTGNSAEFQNISVDDMWSQLCLAAKDPAGESCYTDVIHYFADFRKVTGCHNSAFLEKEFSLEQKFDGETGEIASTEAAAVASLSAPMDFSSIEEADIEEVDIEVAAAVASVSSPMEFGSIEAAAVASTPIDLSYIEAASTPMEIGIITSIEAAATATTPVELCSDSSLDEEKFLNKQEREEVSPTTGSLHDGNLISEPVTHMEQQNLRSEPVTHMEQQNLRSEPMEHTTTSEKETQQEQLLNKQNLPPDENRFNTGLVHQNEDGNLASELSNQVESSPTAFILKFTNFDWGPSAKDLNQIFARFGPLIESKTELLERTKCVRVVFKRRIDAESAFCSAGDYSILPSLKSYRLKILPPPIPKKATGKKRGRKSKKEIASMNATTV